MSIISRTYFKDEIRIANINSVSPNDEAGNGPLLDRFINKYEREVLIKCLGYHLYNEFKLQFDIDATTGVWTLKGDADAKWDELLNGLEYQINGVNAIWRGLIHTNSDIDGADADHSLIAYYVYSKFVNSEEYTHAGIGFQREKAKNAMIVSGVTKSVNAWNTFVDMVEHRHDETLEVTLYDFIQDMNVLDSTTYPNWQGECFKYENRFSL